MKLDWRRAITYITTAGMEGCWLYSIAALLNIKVADGRLSIPALMLVYVVSFVFNRLLLRRRWLNVLLVSINVLAWAVAMLLMLKTQFYAGVPWTDTTWLVAMPQAIADLIYTFKPELLVLLGSGAAWFLGRRLAHIEPDFAISVAEFQFGLAILVMMFFTASQLTPENAGSVPLALVFFLFGLVGISITHARDSTGWLSGLQRHRWSGLLVITIVIVILLGLLIGWLVTPDLLQTILNGVNWLWDQFLRVLEFLLSLLPKPEPGEMPPITPLPGGGGGGEKEEKLWVLPETVQAVLRIMFNVIIIGLTLMALWRISSQIIGWLRRRSASQDAEVESLHGAFKDDLLALLKGLLYWPLALFRLFLALFGLKKSRPVLPEIASVRQVYRQLLKWASSHGHPRDMAQTPHEYLDTLLGLLPQARADLEFVTSQYVSIRYCSLVPTEDELEELKQSWHRIKQNRFGKRGR